MSCSICKTNPVSTINTNGSKYALNMYALGYNAITDGSGELVCKTCFGEVSNIINFVNKNKKKKSISYPADNNWGQRLIEELTEKKESFGDLAVLFREGIHSDIQVKPGSGHPISSHKFVLATRSEIFKNSLATGKCKAEAAANDSISLPEFNHQELKAFLEFLYVGSLAKEKVEKHADCLLLAADKYMIPQLQNFCEKHIVSSLDSSNALKVLEMSEVVPNETLKHAALKSIVQNKNEIFGSPGFEEFAKQNPHLMVHISRAFMNDDLPSNLPKKKKRAGY